jgi:transcriptional regulator with XRE-family HTH domain
MPDVTGGQLRTMRREARLTQVEAAKRLKVSQSYLSMLESGARPVSRRLLTRLRRVYAVPATALPVSSEQPLDPQRLAVALGTLGYPGYLYLSDARSTLNPAAVLLFGLKQDLEPRLAVALPWLVLRYSEMPWDWLVEQAKVRDLQNRLGFVVTLAREVAERRENTALASLLRDVEARLERARLVREDVFGRAAVTRTERRWLQETRSSAAQHWNLLTRLSAEHVPDAA